MRVEGMEILTLCSATSETEDLQLGLARHQNNLCTNRNNTTADEAVMR